MKQENNGVREKGENVLCEVEIERMHFNTRTKV